MSDRPNLLQVIPVIPTSDMVRDVRWYEEKTGFKKAFGDDMYSGLRKDTIEFHLQWHSRTKDDPINGGSVIKFFVNDIQIAFEEMVQRGTVSSDKIHLNTPWNTHEFGFYDLNNNAIFFVQDV